MKKRISYADWTAIGPYNHAAKWLRPMCKYTLVKEGNKFKREQCVPLWFYLLIFIPAHLIQALYCMWDGGLREFEFADRYLGGDYLGFEVTIWVLRVIPPMKKQKKFGKGLDKALSLCYN